MENLIHNPPSAATRIYSHYQKAQIDYANLFLRLYIAYNAWYREITGTSNDRRALILLKERFVIWDDYCQGKTMKTLSVYMERLADYTQKEPFPSTKLYWNGELDNAKDWKSLIEYWYQVRCLIVHGVDIKPKYVWLAYETLDIFMGEITDRMRSCFTKADFTKLQELSSLAEQNPERSKRFKRVQHMLYQKYIASPDIWQVDMQRVEESIG